MSDSDYKQRMGTLTPVPFDDLKAVSRNVQKVGTAVTRIESTLGIIKNDLLPPVSEAAKEARDGVLTLSGRVRALEEADPPDHECTESSRQARQDNDIAEVRTRTANIGRLVWWLMGIAVVVGGSAISFAIYTKSTSTENATRIQSYERDLVRHEDEIKAIEEAQRKDRELYLKEIRALPVKVQQVAEKEQSIESVIDTVQDFPLTESEKVTLQRILSKARKRSSGTVQ